MKILLSITLLIWLAISIFAFTIGMRLISNDYKVDVEVIEQLEGWSK